MFLSISEAASFIGVSPSTLRRYERQGAIKPIRTTGGHRRFSISQLRLLSGEVVDSPEYTIAYARVSSHDQKDDLARQVQRLDEYCRARGDSYIVLDDLGSGLNYKKRGLKKLIREIISGRVSRIVTHKDRLLRFGSEIIFYLCSFYGTKVELIEDDPNLSDEEILTRDVIEIITVFSARLYGKRAHKKKSLAPA